ncbi:hypothetical protein D3C86_2235550 [compost metagenome]
MAGLSYSGANRLGVTTLISLETILVTDLEVASPPNVPWNTTGNFTSAAIFSFPVRVNVSVSLE